MLKVEYRGFVIEPNIYNYTKWDAYEYMHKDYDGPEDRRAGYAESVEQAMVTIDDDFFDGHRPLVGVGEAWAIAGLFSIVIWGSILWTYAYWS